MVVCVCVCVSNIRPGCVMWYYRLYLPQTNTHTSRPSLPSSLPPLSPLKVVAIHCAGTDTTSFELDSDYAIAALKGLQTGVAVRRGYIGARLGLVTVGEAQRFYLLPKAAAAKQKRSMFGGPPHVAIVNTIIPGSPARGKLKLGDIVYSVDGKAFGENLAKYTRSLNAALGAPEAPEPHNAKVSLGVYRHGAKKNIVIDVQNGETCDKLLRYVKFAGAVFHDLNSGAATECGVPSVGVFMSHARAGGTFASVGSSPSGPAAKGKSNKNVVLVEVGGVPVKSLDDFTKVVSQLPNGANLFVTAVDCLSSVDPIAIPITIRYEAGVLCGVLCGVVYCVVWCTVWCTVLRVLCAVLCGVLYCGICCACCRRVLTQMFPLLLPQVRGGGALPVRPL